MHARRLNSNLLDSVVFGKIHRSPAPEEVKEAIRVRRETHTRCLSSKSTVQCEKYAKARKAVKKMAEKKGKWEDIVRKPNEDFDGGMKQM